MDSGEGLEKTHCTNFAQSPEQKTQDSVILKELVADEPGKPDSPNYEKSPFAFSRLHKAKNLRCHRRHGERHIDLPLHRPK